MNESQTPELIVWASSFNCLDIIIQLFGHHHHQRDGVVVRASASQSVDLGFIPLVESYQKALKNGVYSFPAWHSSFIGGCGEQAGKFACCVFGQGTQRDSPTFM